MRPVLGLAAFLGSLSLCLMRRGRMLPARMRHVTFVRSIFGFVIDLGRYETDDQYGETRRAEREFAGCDAAMPWVTGGCRNVVRVWTAHSLSLLPWISRLGYWRGRSISASILHVIIYILADGWIDKMRSGIWGFSGEGVSNIRFSESCYLFMSARLICDHFSPASSIRDAM
jgi:hypothetical protein